jgi:hypothetical protein
MAKAVQFGQAAKQRGKFRDAMAARATNLLEWVSGGCMPEGCCCGDSGPDVGNGSAAAVRSYSRLVDGAYLLISRVGQFETFDIVV